MFQYADGNGNSFVLELEEVPALHLNAAFLPTGNGTAIAQMSKTKLLSENGCRELVAAFQLAIDNKLQHAELLAGDTGMITRLENGSQRRFMLCANCHERKLLEHTLWKLLET